MTIDSGRVTGSREPDPSSTGGSGPPGFDPARVGLHNRLPKDFAMNWHGDFVSLSATCPTVHEIDAVVEALLIMRRALPATRDALAGDFGLEIPERPFAERLAEFLGVPPAASNGEAVPEGIPSKRHSKKAIAMEARQGGDARLHPKDDSAGRQASPGTGEGTDHG